ncbi:MAG: hypothetical protein ACOYOE_12015 [Chlorobium sp.]
MRQATKLIEIDAAVDRFSPVTPDHPFYVDFKDLRGDFQEKKVMRSLGVMKKSKGDYEFNYDPQQTHKTFLFIAGMRGSGKTSELSKYTRLLNTPDCFFVVVCNIDNELDMDNVQYMDILIFQLEKLLERAEEINLKLDTSIVESMSKWFQDRVKEINTSCKADGSAEIELDTDKPLSLGSIFSKILGLTARLKMGLSGSREYAETIRSTFQNRFIDFSAKFNTFIEQTNEQLRRENKGREILFIIDGLEKTMSSETRRKIIMEESNRIRQIKATTIFTLPIELMKEEPHIRNFSTIITFPFVKVKERDGSPVKAAVELFREFVNKRIHPSLFDSEATVNKVIEYSGGSPRELLRIIERANWYADEEAGKITDQSVEQALDELGNNNGRYLEPDEFALLKELKEKLDAGAPIGFNNNIQSLLEKGVLFEYNDGTYKSVNPLLTRSKLYKHDVLGE